MINRLENGHEGKYGPILEFGVPLGFNSLTHIYYIIMEYLSVLIGLLFTPCKFKLGFYGACKDIFKHFDDGSHDIFGSELWEKWGGVGGVQP